MIIIINNNIFIKIILTYRYMNKIERDTVKILTQNENQTYALFLIFVSLKDNYYKYHML